MRNEIYTEATIANLRIALARTDQIAYENVTHDNEGRSILDETGTPIKGKFSRGGPFGAMLAIVHEDGTVEQIGEARGNNVVGSGIASRHAEDQVLQPDNYKLLVERLTELKAQGKNPDVWLISSGQSCTTCHTKQEIAKRDLEARGLTNQWKTLYGATYDDTFNIAQFYDAQYADAIAFFARDNSDDANLIRQGEIFYQMAPLPVQDILINARVPTAVIVRDGKVYATGQESRSAFDLYSTAEVNAVQAACTKHREGDDAFKSWEIDGLLYTTNYSMGPLLFAEAGWTKIDTVRTVKMPPQFNTLQYQTQEAAGIGNSKFLETVANGYYEPSASLKVYRDYQFINTAQPKWAEILKINEEQLYNGAAVKPEVEAMRGYTQLRFEAPDLSECAKDDGLTSLRLLSRLPTNRLKILQS